MCSTCPFLQARKAALKLLIYSRKLRIPNHIWCRYAWFILLVNMIFKLKIIYLAHVWRAAGMMTSMRRFSEIMVREDPKPAFFIYESWVGIDLWKAFHQAMMLQNCLDEEHVRITYNLQITPEINNGIATKTLSIFVARKPERKHKERENCKQYPKAWADLMAWMIRGCIGVLFRTATMSSIFVPCKWSSFIIRSCNLLYIKK